MDSEEENGDGATRVRAAALPEDFTLPEIRALIRGLSSFGDSHSLVRIRIGSRATKRDAKYRVTSFIT